MTKEENDLRLAAYSYLDEWLLTDRRLHLKLLQANEDRNLAVGASALTAFASNYKVSRTLKLINEPQRLESAYSSLAAVDDIDGENMVSKVCEYASVLQKSYAGKADSAATKFLWLRFRTPVIIYDSFAWKWVAERSAEQQDRKALRSDKMVEFYPVFVKIWRREFQRCRSSIAEACLDLLNVVRFTRASEESPQELELWLASDWFFERVFDHYILEQSEKMES